MTGPLSGVRVLELATFWAGPAIGALLADYGAEVVKVEDAEGDPLRCISDPRLDVPMWALAGRGKKSVMLTLGTPEGRRDFTALVARADVIILNQSERVLAAWDTSLDELRLTNTEAIICVLSAFGHGDPRTGNGTTVEAAGGITGSSDTPALSPMLMGDYAATMSATVAIVTALYARRGAQSGRVLHVPMVDVALAAVLPDINRTRDGAAVPVRGVFATADGVHISLSATSTPQKKRLAMLLKADWASAGAETMTNDVRLWIAQRDRATVVDEFDAHRIPAHPVLRPNEAAHRRQHESPSSIVTIRDQRFGDVMLPVPIGVDAHEYRPALGGALGADTEHILAAWVEDAAHDD